MRIIWIDDDTDIIEPVVQPLIRDGHEISRMRSISEALDAANRFQNCDLVLLDLILPPGNDEDYGSYPGITLLRRLREEHGITIPVIVFSVVNPANVDEQLGPLGVSDYVRKPALPSELKKAVDAVLSEKSLGRQ